jgi:hypothetical protein
MRAQRAREEQRSDREVLGPCTRGDDCRIHAAI